MTSEHNSRYCKSLCKYSLYQYYVKKILNKIPNTTKKSKKYNLVIRVECNASK